MGIARAIRTVLWVQVVWAVAGGLTSCGREGGGPPAPAVLPCPGGELRVLSEPAQHLDPVAANEVYESVVLRQIYEGLVTLDAGLRLQPGLASTWTISPDRMHYTFHLRSGVRFHDGSTLTAEGVAASLSRCIGPRRDGGCLAETYLLHIEGAREYRSGRSARVEGIHILNDRDLEIVLSAPLSIFLKVLAMDQTLIVAPSVALAGDAPFPANRPTGTGPFRFVDRQDDRGILLARFDDYWGQKSMLDSLVFRPLPLRPKAGGRGAPERLSEVQALAEGYVQFAELPSGTSKTLGRSNVTVYRGPELSVSFLGLRCDLPPLDNPEIRRAILLAIHRDSLAQIDPEGIVAAQGWLPPGVPGRDPRYRMPAPDPEAARVLLAKAGHPGGRGLPPILLGTADGFSTEKLTRPILRDLRAVGFDVRLERLPWRELDKMTSEGTLHAFLMSWVADLPDPDAFLFPLFHTAGESNLFAYRSAEADSLLEWGRALPGGPDRTQLYTLLQDCLLRDTPMVPLYHNSLAYAWERNLRGIEIGPGGFAMIPFSKVYVLEGASSPQRSSWP